MTRWAAYGVVLVALGAVPAAASSPPGLPAPVDLGGTRVEASSNPDDPTLLTAGLWADTLTGPGAPPANAHWFRYERTMQYSSVLVGVVATSPSDTPVSDNLDVTVLAPDGSSCATQSSSSGNPNPVAAFGVRLEVPNDLPDREDPCLRAESLDIRVTRGTSTLEGDLPLAIRVVEEAPVVSEEAELPAVVETPSVPLPDPGEPTPLDGGRSFDDAPELEPGRTVSDAVPEGAEHLYRVRLDWGQALAVRIDVPAQSPEDAEVLAGGTPDLRLTVHDPLRNAFDTEDDEGTPDGEYGEEPSGLADTTRPVTWLNRFDDLSMSVPGDYWVSVSAAPPTQTSVEQGRPTIEVPFELTVDVVGEVGGAPEFQGVVLSPSTGAGPDGYDPTTPFLVADGVFAAEVSGTPRATEASGDDVRRTAGLVVGAASLLSLAAGAVLLRRRGRVSRAAAR
ncbi:MAG: hypothetical protein JWN84_1712 [Nocardioides sp.]|nr:hypothetical protein [Nocardioides sp.]